MIISGKCFSSGDAGRGMGALRCRPAAPASAEAASPTLNAHAVACQVLCDYADLRINIKHGEAAWPRSRLRPSYSLE